MAFLAMGLDPLGTKSLILSLFIDDGITVQAKVYVEKEKFGYSIRPADKNSVRVIKKYKLVEVVA